MLVSNFFKSTVGKLIVGIAVFVEGVALLPVASAFVMAPFLVLLLAPALVIATCLLVGVAAGLVGGLSGFSNSQKVDENIAEAFGAFGLGGAPYTTSDIAINKLYASLGLDLG